VPALVAFVSIYGLVASPSEIAGDVTDLLGAAPQEVRDLVETQMQAVADGNSSGAALGAILGIVVALWAASSGMKHAIEGTNAAYDEEETRGFVKLRVISLLLTMGALAGGLVAVVLLAVLPSALGDAPDPVRIALSIVRWPILAVGFMAGLAVFYRYAPNRDDPQWRWASPGALVATVLWLAGSALFSVYTANFGKYNETYGSLGAVIVVMLWLYITALVVILGAELNSEMERQTRKDTTRGREKPMGRRQAYAADTVGEPAEAMKAGATRSPRDDRD
jgi:membrane protein